MIETKQPRIAAAIEALEAEQRIVSAEKRAFEAFRARLSNLDCTTPSTNAPAATAAGPSTLVDTGGAPSEALRRIRVAYRETVMDVPHYESEYGDSLVENLTAEFGSDVARCLVAGTGLTPILYEGLLDAAEQATTERRRFLAVLRRERESLQRIETELDDCERRAVELIDRISTASESGTLGRLDGELADLERQCESLSSRRQETIHGRSFTAFSGVDDGSLSGYLYEDCETSFPALADISRCVETIRHARRRCLR
jgi:hypothetical protein